MPAIHLQNLSFSYSSAVEVFDDVSVDLGGGWTGVVGPNGAGKSTLLSLIAGDLPPNAGSVLLDPAGAAVVWCRQEVDAPTGEIEAFAEATAGVARKWMGRLEIDPTSLHRWDSLSPGERKRWQLGAALASEPNILLLDEPTNHIDRKARGLVEEALARFLGVGLVISHDRSLLDRLTQRTLRVRRGTLRLWSAPYSTALEAWTAEEESQREEHAKVRKSERALKKRLADERRAADQRNARHKRQLRKANPKDHDATSMAAKGRHESGRVAGQRRRTVIRSAMERAGAAAHDLAPEKGLGGSIFFDYEAAPKRRVLHFSGPLQAGPVLLSEKIEVELLRDDRVRLVGPNGAGKSTLLKRLVEGRKIPKGRLLFLPQELSRDEGVHLLSELDQLSPDRRGRVLSVVDALGVDPEDLLASGRPSPGEARKLVIALGLGVGAWAMVLDEPTNHLDLPAVEEIERALGSYPGALLVVTHDEAFGTRATKTRWKLESGVLSVTGGA